GKYTFLHTFGVRYNLLRTPTQKRGLKTPACILAHLRRAAELDTVECFFPYLGRYSLTIFSHSFGVLPNFVQKTMTKTKKSVPIR
ncbi:MAG: hypothetical protein K6E86_06270, partial [Bacteroidales bacterium]|nr:hypothetical protein [Bacteroidales bacterium]